MKARKLNFNTFDEAIAEIEHLTACGYRKTGKWSLGQVCEHLALSLEQVMEGKTFHVPAIVRVISPLFKKRFFRGRQMPSGVKAPPVLQPHDGPDESRKISRAVGALRTFAAFAGPFPRNPIFGTLTPAEWRDLELIHAAHHQGHLIPTDAAA